MQAGFDTLPPYSPLLFALFFVAVWTLACFLISIVSGWFSLSQRFTMQAEPVGDTKSAGPFFYSVYMRFLCNYSSVIRVTVAADALYLSVLFPFRIGHPPLRIPWEEIEMERSTFLWMKYIVLTLGREERIRLSIPAQMASHLGILGGIPKGAGSLAISGGV